MLPLQFVPYHQLDGRPNVIVDGSATDGTVLTLSHWPGSPTPDDLLDDLSAQIAFRALDVPVRFAGVDAVSNNHFDQDGLVSAFTLIEPDAAMSRRGLLIDIARAGDFGTFASRDAARLAFALAAYDDPARSPLGPDVFDQPYDVRCGHLYEALLPRLAELVDRPALTRPLWQDEDDHLTESLDAIAAGVVTIHERPDVDLAIVTVPDDWAQRSATRFTVHRHDAVHPMAINQSTQRFRLLIRQDSMWQLELRYESWVMYRSRPVLARPDLRILAEQLTSMEPTTAAWAADRPGALTPHLRSPDDGSDLAADVIERTIVQFLATAELAWDPMSGR